MAVTKRSRASRFAYRVPGLIVPGPRFVENVGNNSPGMVLSADGQEVSYTLANGDSKSILTPVKFDDEYSPWAETCDIKWLNFYRQMFKKLGNAVYDTDSTIKYHWITKRTDLTGAQCNTKEKANTGQWMVPVRNFLTTTSVPLWRGDKTVGLTTTACYAVKATEDYYKTFSGSPMRFLSVGVDWMTGVVAFLGTTGSRQTSDIGTIIHFHAIEGVIHNALVPGTYLTKTVLITLSKGSIDTSWMDDEGFVPTFNTTRELGVGVSGSVKLQFLRAKNLGHGCFALTGVSVTGGVVAAGSVLVPSSNTTPVTFFSDKYLGSSRYFGMSIKNTDTLTFINSVTGVRNYSAGFGVPNIPGLSPSFAGILTAGGFGGMPLIGGVEEFYTGFAYGTQSFRSVLDFLVNSPLLDDLKATDLSDRFHVLNDFDKIVQRTVSVIDAMAAITAIAGPYEALYTPLFDSNTTATQGAGSLRTYTNVGTNPFLDSHANIGYYLVFDKNLGRFFAYASGQVVHDNAFTEDALILSWRAYDTNGNLLAPLTAGTNGADIADSSALSGAAPSASLVLVDANGMSLTSYVRISHYYRGNSPSSAVPDGLFVGNCKGHKGVVYGVKSGGAVKGQSASACSNSRSVADKDSNSPIDGGYVLSGSGGVYDCYTSGPFTVPDTNKHFPCSIAGSWVTADFYSTTDGTWAFIPTILGLVNTNGSPLSGSSASKTYSSGTLLTSSYPTLPPISAWPDSGGGSFSYAASTSFSRSGSGQGSATGSVGGNFIDISSHLPDTPKLSHKVTLVILLFGKSYGPGAFSPNFSAPIGTAAQLHVNVGTYPDFGVLNSVSGSGSDGQVTDTNIDNLQAFGVGGVLDVYATVSFESNDTSTDFNGLSNQRTLIFPVADLVQIPDAVSATNPQSSKQGTAEVSTTHTPGSLSVLAYMADQPIPAAPFTTGPDTFPIATDPFGPISPTGPFQHNKYGTTLMQTPLGVCAKFAIRRPDMHSLLEGMRVKGSTLPRALLYPAKPGKLCMSTTNRLTPENMLCWSGVTKNQLLGSRILNLYANVDGVPVSVNGTETFTHIGGDVVKAYNLNPGVGRVTISGGKVVYTAVKAGYDYIIAYDSFNKVPGVVSINVTAQRLGRCSLSFGNTTVLYMEGEDIGSEMTSAGISLNVAVVVSSVLVASAPLRLTPPSGNISYQPSAVNAELIPATINRLINVAYNPTEIGAHTLSMSLDTRDNSSFTGAVYDTVNFTIFTLTSGTNVQRGGKVTITSTDGKPWEATLCRSVPTLIAGVAAHALVPLAQDYHLSTSDRITWTLSAPLDWTESTVCVVGKVPGERCYACSPEILVV